MASYDVSIQFISVDGSKLAFVAISPFIKSHFIVSLHMGIYILWKNHYFALSAFNLLSLFNVSLQVTSEAVSKQSDLTNIAVDLCSGLMSSPHMLAHKVSINHFLA